MYLPAAMRIHLHQAIVIVNDVLCYSLSTVLSTSLGCTSNTEVKNITPTSSTVHNLFPFRLQGLYFCAFFSDDKQ